MIISLLLLFVPTKKSKVDASPASMTLAGYLAGGSATIATGPLLLGLFGVIAVGGVIANWETIEQYGSNVWNDLTAKGLDPDSLVDEKNMTVKVTDDLIHSAATQVDTMPSKIAQNSSGWVFASKPVYELLKSYNKSASPLSGAFPNRFAAGSYKIAVAFDYVIKSFIDIPTRAFWFSADTIYGSTNNGKIHTFDNFPAINDKTVSGSIFHTFEVSYGVSWNLNRISLYAANSDATISNVRAAVYQDENALSGGYVNTSDTFGTVSANVSTRISNAQSVFAENEVITFDSRADVSAATLSDISNISDKTLDQEVEQTGFLSGIKSGINNLIGIISGFLEPIISAITAVPKAILNGLLGLLNNIYNGVLNMPDAMSNLWEDAGLIWSGMLDTLQNLDLAFPDTLTNIWTGILNGVSSIGNVLDNLWDWTLSLPGIISNSISDTLTWTLSLPSTIADSITSALTWAFVIPDGYIIARTTELDLSLSNKFTNVPDAKRFFSNYDGDMNEWPGLSANFSHYGIGTQKVVDNKSANYYSRQIKMWIGAMLYFLTLLFIIRKIADLLSK